VAFLLLEGFLEQQWVSTCKHVAHRRLELALRSVDVLRILRNMYWSFA
jgi:hypothetical protein